MPHVSHYRTALTSSGLDTSDFILLTVIILKETLTDPGHFDQIYQSYIQYDYKTAVDKIIALCQEPEFELKNPELSQFIIERNKTLTNDPEANQSRRYFESHFSQYLWETQSQDTFNALKKLSQLMRDINPTLDVPSDVKSLEDARKTIAAVRGLVESTERLLGFEKMLRHHTDSLSRKKDRGKFKDPKGVLHSMHPGIMKSTQPLFRDELTSPNVNRVVDICSMDKEHPGYSHEHKTVPFVNSISGTAYAIAILINQYIQENLEDKNLNDDINHIIRTFLAFTCLQGYHSLAEMIDVFHSKEVREILSPIELNTNYYAPDLVYLFNQAAEYSKVLNLHRIALGQIKAKKRTYPSILVDYDVKEKDATGPRVAKAIAQIAKDKDAVFALAIIDQFYDYARNKKRHYTLSDLKTLEFSLEKQILLTASTSPPCKKGKLTPPKL